MKLKSTFIELIFYGVIFISCLVSMDITIRRYHFETQLKKVSLAMTDKSIETLAKRSGIEKMRLLQRLRDEVGLKSVVINEDTVGSLEKEGLLTLLNGSELKNLSRVSLSSSFLTNLLKQSEMTSEHLFICTDEMDIFDRVRTILSIEFGNENIKQIGNQLMLDIIADKEDLANIGVGISKQKLEILKELGLNPMIKLQNSSRVNEQLIKEKLDTFINDVPSPTLLFDSLSVLGYPKHLKYLEDKIKDNNINIGLIEFSKPLGFDELSLPLSKKIIRIHAIGEQEVEKLSKEKVLSRYERAIKERGIKVVLLQPFLQHPEEGSILDFNLNNFSTLKSNLSRNGFEVGHIAGIVTDYYLPVKHWESMILSIGVLTTIIYLLNHFLPLSFTQFIGLTGVMASLFWGVYALGGFFIWNKIMALLTAISFPSLAIISQFPFEPISKKEEYPIFSSLLFLLKTVGITLIGSFFIVGFLSHTRFIYGADQFTGIKLAFVIPLGLIGLYYYIMPHRLSSTIFVLKRFIQSPVQTVGLLSVMICFISIGIALIRSGNVASWMSLDIEDHFRFLLENFLPVRPRTKEFLIGYPFLLISYWYVNQGIHKKWSWFFLVLGSLGLLSVVNSFCHIHTPIMISMNRVLIGLILGIFVAFIYRLLIKLGSYLYQQLIK